MIWFNRVGPIQPIGSPVGTATVGGRAWEVWSGSNGSNDVLSFVAPSAITGWSWTSWTSSGRPWPADSPRTTGT
ncbi:hypothetical protein STENM36S_05072 [Streptomyces tendae]